MIYAYKCRNCGWTADSTTRADVLGECHNCHGANLTRDYSGVSIARPMMPHFNPTVQQEVIGNRDFKEKLHVMGEKYTENTGLPVKYVPVHYSDLPATNEGLDSTNRVRAARGQKPITAPG